MFVETKKSSCGEADIHLVQEKQDHEVEQEQRLKEATEFPSRIGLTVNAEIRGIKRVPEDKRVDRSWSSPLTMFISHNLAISALSTGILGPTYFPIDFKTCVLCGIFMPIINAVPVNVCAIFGAKFGLRQQILSRYFTGNIMGSVFAFFNVVSCIGWNAINVLPAAQMPASLGKLPPWAGCLIFEVITCAMTFFGYKVIHLYERWSWIPNLVVYLVKICLAMVVGMNEPCIFTLILGSAFAMGTKSDPSWQQAYDDNSVVGLVNKILVEDSLHRFGKVCVVFLAMSAAANNLPGSDSLSLSMQAISSRLARFPRLGWCVIGNFVSLALSIPAYYVFADALINFRSIIAYNVSIYIGITVAELRLQ